ncbi:alpha/beta hydrolase [Streptomyces sp. NPDC018031]|uniref:alpha/beta hydrolase n=1 Tax=Streptomyces sp. NPDC018031 TaxID=3365033 RepID=UPI0037B7767D
MTPRPDFEPGPPPGPSHGTAAPAGRQRPRVPLPEVDVVSSATESGGRPALTVRPATGTVRGTVLHLHGGGYRMGSPAGGEPLSAHLSARTRTEVVSPAYRLAPRHPFPAAVDDALAGYRELLERGVAPERLVLLGGSAGGGLAVAVLLAAREAGLPRPAAAVCLSPWFDLTVTADSYDRCAARDPMLGRAVLRESAEAYLAGADPRDPLASPLFADEAALAWLPPLLVQVGEGEVLVDDATRFAARVVQAGGSCLVERWPDATHGWQLFVRESAAAVEAADAVARFIDARLP